MQRSTTCVAATMLAAAAVTCPAAASDWIHFVDETTERLIADPAVGANDPEQKYFAHGDLNNNGRMDVVIARKTPWNSPGRRTNVLLMNEGIAEGHAIDGVLVDRTAKYATSADDGGNGFLDKTNDTSIIVVDANNDGWLDVVTSTTLSTGLPKSISHPRVYVNLGEDSNGNWQGLRYESSRIPEFAHEPRFVEVGAGDVTGDGSPDLFFAYTYLGSPPLDPEDRLGDRLLINDGRGNFADESEQRLLAEGSLDVLSNAIVIADINSNGINDLIKNRYPAAYYTGISYNDPQNVGHFTVHVNVHQLSPSYMAVGDLNNNSLLDLFITDVDWDRYLLNQGNDEDGIAQFEMHLIPDSFGFDGRLVIVDLDHDGWLDVFKPDQHWDLGT